VERDKKPPFSEATFKRAGIDREGLSTFVPRAERLFYRTKAVFLGIRNSGNAPFHLQGYTAKALKEDPIFSRHCPAKPRLQRLFSMF
jgi:hypothetical protein